MITIELNQDIFIPGQMLRGECYWHTYLETHSRAAQLSIGWSTQGRGDPEHDWYTQPLELIPHIAVPFEWEIPLKAPPSYEGDLISIFWEVTVVARGGDRLPHGFAARVEAIRQNSSPKEIVVKRFQVVSELSLHNG